MVNSRHQEGNDRRDHPEEEDVVADAQEAVFLRQYDPQVVKVPRHGTVQEVLVPDHLHHAVVKVIDGHRVEVTEEEEVGALGLDVGQVGFPLRHLGPRRLDGVEQTAQANADQDHRRDGQVGVTIQLRHQVGRHDTQDDRVDGQHNVRLVIGNGTQVDVGPVSGPVHRLHAPAGLKFGGLVLLVGLLDGLLQLLEFLLLLLGGFEFFEVAGGLVGEQGFLAFVELLDVLAFPFAKHLAGGLRVVLVIEHEIEFEVDPFLVRHHHVPCQGELLADAAAAVPVAQVSQVAQVGVGYDLFDHVPGFLGHAGRQNAAPDHLLEFLVLYFLGPEEIQGVGDAALLVVLPTLGVARIVEPGGNLDGQHFLGRTLVVLGQLVGGFDDGAGVLKIVVDELGVDVLQDELLDVSFNAGKQRGMVQGGTHGGKIRNPSAPHPQPGL